MSNILALLVPFFTATADTGAAPAAHTDSSAMTLVVVQNDRDVPVTIYAQNDFGEYKLGVVSPGDARTLEIEPFIFDEGDIEFFVQPKGQLEQSAGPITLRRGERIGVLVPPG
jgi:hypothetical protein